ncbi:hypothetical protein QFC22_002831 [Naganishia vaughanmartiniae]|uniref:Uncharacterized protein n=1 Tax=Naganishia vaughanmartiniae TaxID=1424756 RepID=A0ACC2XCV5_9TREE|nr:hypothetical protein QFC22_002831 [Naganishia vaughanmartiniae]
MSANLEKSRSRPHSVVNNEAVLLHHDAGEDDTKEAIPWVAWAICLLCALAQFQNTFLGIAPAANAYSIAGAVGGMDKRIWIVQAQGIPSIITGPIMAIISDLYGRRWIIVGAFLLASVSSVVGMTASSMTQIIIAQTLAGCAAGISGTMFAVPSEVMPSRYRAHVQTGMSWFSGLASVPALIGMGAATKMDPINGWKWVFRTQLIVNGIICLGFLLIYHPPPRTQTFISFRKRIATLDWIGYFLLFAGLVPLLMGFAWASDSNYGWKNAHAYACVAIGIVGFGACLLYEWKGRDDGFIHHELFRHGWNFPIAVFVIAVEGSLFYLLNNIWPSQVFALYAHDPIIAALYLLPFFMTILVVSPFLSIYATKYKDVKWPIVAGFAFFLSAIIGYGTTTATSNKAAIAL